MSVLTRPCREQLGALVRHYHRVESEHARAHPQGSVRRHLELRLDHDRKRFDHLLAEYVPDEDTRGAWRDFLHHGGGEPSGPPSIRPVVFKGRSEAGSVLEARRDPSGELLVEVDGRLVERLEGPTIPGGDRPWERGSALLADGLIDVDFALTARGRRALKQVPGA